MTLRKGEAVPDISLEALGELMQRTFNEVRGLREDVAEMKDQLFVQSGILLRLEHRDRTADGETLRLLQMVQRLDARVRALEEQ